MKGMEETIMNKLRLLLGIFIIVMMSLALTACKSVDDQEVVDTGIPKDAINNEAFKEKFPLQYEDYQMLKGDGEPPRSKFEDDLEPLIPILFNGGVFASEHNVTRGHYYAIEDQANVLRINDKSPGGCLTCKSTAAPKLIAEEGDDFWKPGSFHEMHAKGEELDQSAVGCVTCHDPQTMDLRLSTPVVEEGLKLQGIDVAYATRNDLRSLACAQCHSEYYFAPSDNKVTFPWKEGFKAEEMLSYFNGEIRESGFERDFVSNISGADMIKAQHPEYEMSRSGPHAKADVSCADCHMPFKIDLGKKYSNHKLGSPLETMDASCSPCHTNRDMDDLKKQVQDGQKAFKEGLAVAQETSAYAHYYVNKMITSGVDADKIAEAQEAVRNGQWFWDYNAAENSHGFHNPQGAMENNMKSIQYSNQAIKIATEELVKKGVDIDELKAEIKKVINAVKAEPDPAKKKDLATNHYFPSQQP